MLWSVPWRHLRLVWRVGGRELRAADHLAHDGRDEVAVHAGAEEADLRDPVAAGQASELRADLLLGERRRDVPGAGADRGRDVGEEILDRSDADRLEHPRSIGIGVWRVGHGQPAVRRSRQRSRPRPGGRRARTRSDISTFAIHPSPNGSEFSSSGVSRSASLTSTTSPGDRREEVAHGLHALDHAERRELAQRGADLGQLDEHDVAQLIGREARDADRRARTLLADPLVLLGVGQVVGVGHARVRSSLGVRRVSRAGADRTATLPARPDRGGRAPRPRTRCRCRPSPPPPWPSRSSCRASATASRS